MATTRTVTDSITISPSNYTGLTNLTTNSSYPVSNGYDESSSTNYARFTLGTSSTGYLYYTFDTSDIPADATITSVSANFKARVGNTSRVTNSTCQLYSGTTAKGSSTAFASTTASVRSMSVGSWTRSELSDLRLRIGATGSSSTSSKRFDFYGADVTINYSYQQTVYEINISNSTGISVTASETEPLAGENVEITASSLSGITITDNGTDVTSLFVTETAGSNDYFPTSNTNTNFTLTNIDEAYNYADNTSYATLACAGGSTTGTLYLNFEDISLPTGAVLQSVSAQATIQFSANGSSSGVTASCQMYSGSTAKGSSTTITTSATDVAKTTYDLTVGSWSASELASAKFCITMTNNASSTVRYLYVYGVTLTVTYEFDSAVYVYTISNISADHTIVVVSSGGQDAVYIKVNGAWVEATEVYKKVNGSWVKQTDLSSVFDANTNYVKGN